MDAAQNASYEETSHFTHKLDAHECKFFELGQKSLKDFEVWKQGQTNKITTSSTVLNHKKRKRGDVDP